MHTVSLAVSSMMIQNVPFFYQRLHRHFMMCICGHVIVYNISFLMCEVYFCIVVGTLIKEFILFLSSDAASHLVSHLLSSSIKSACSG